MTQVPSTCLIIGGLPSSLINFRGALLKLLRARGCAVHAAAGGRDVVTESRLRELGVVYHPLRMARAGLNPLHDLATLRDVYRLMRRIRPGLVLTYTIKPVIYGGLAARWAKVGRIYSLITGLGYAFMNSATPVQRWVSQIARRLYRVSLRYSRRVIFQNPDDAQAFQRWGLVRAGQAAVVRGSGVDIEHYPALPLSPGPPSRLRLLLIARLLKDKGVVEYVEAARRLKSALPDLEFHLVGALDPNPASLTRAEVYEWERAGLIRYHGALEDVRPELARCHIYVLPSYREGTPRTVLEAMATGRPVITTDVPGCRETIAPPDGGWVRSGPLLIGQNGLLVPARNGQALAEAIAWLAQRPEQMATMGMKGRAWAEAYYDVRSVNLSMLEVMELS